MTVKSRLLQIALFSTVVSFLLFSCKKKRAFNEEDALDTAEARVTQGESDEVLKDVNTVIMEQFLLRGKNGEINGVTSSGPTSVCGVAIDTSQLAGGVVSLLYDGSNCYGKSRSGTIKISMLGYPLVKWKHVNCTLRVEFVDLKIHRSSDGKTYLLKGTQYYVNESGGTWYDLWYLSQPKLVYRITGDGFRVTFDNDDFAKFSFSRRVTFTYSNSVTFCQVEGIGTIDGRGGLENWGQNRDGESFTSEVTSPYTWCTACGAIAPISGEVVIRVHNKEHALISSYGVDQSGNSLSGSMNPCPFGWKVKWSYKNKTKTQVFSYY
jgi:hypothetical protein